MNRTIVLLFFGCLVVTGCGSLTKSKLQGDYAEAKTAVQDAKAEYENCVHSNQGNSSKCTKLKQLYDEAVAEWNKLKH